MADRAPNPPETEVLLRRVRDGDRQALEQLFADHDPFLRRVIELRLDPRLRARVDPSDVVQEVQLDVLRRLEDYLERQPMPFRLWLWRTARERLLKVRRHAEAAQRTFRREVPLTDHSSLLLAQRLLAPDATPSQRLDQSEVARRVRQAVAQLSAADQEILLMRSFEEMSNQEAAQVLQIDPATASQRFGRALLRLRKRLLESGVMEALS